MKIGEVLAKLSQGNMCWITVSSALGPGVTDVIFRPQNGHLLTVALNAKQIADKFTDWNQIFKESFENVSLFLIFEENTVAALDYTGNSERKSDPRETKKPPKW